MCSAQYFREFVNDRLTAAAEDILEVFQKTIVKYEKEIDRQRKLLAVVYKPEIKLHSIELELPQQNVLKQEEVLTNQQLCIPEPPQIKEEEEELCSSQEGEQLVLKQETDVFMWTHEDSDHSEDQTLNFNPEVSLPVISSVVSEAHEDPLKSLKCDTYGTDFQFGLCRTCGTNFSSASGLKTHQIVHTGEKPYSCKTCGQHFGLSSRLKVHMRAHTGERPYICKTCGKDFKHVHAMKVHMRIHTDEKPFNCKLCRKDFRRGHDLKIHMRTHTGEKPYTCELCGKHFGRSHVLKDHMRTHTGEKPYRCDTCGKGFGYMSALTRHMEIHTGEEPYSCNTCEKDSVGLERPHADPHR